MSNRSFTFTAAHGAPACLAATAAPSACLPPAGMSAAPASANSPVQKQAKPRTTQGRGRARPQAQPYLEGSGFAIRSRHKGHDIYLSGYATETAIKREIGERRNQIDRQGAPRGLGPERTSAAQALQDYAMERLRFKKGAVQEAVRINHYLRAAQLDTLLVTPHKPQAEPAADPNPGKGVERGLQKQSVFFDVTLQPCAPERVIPKGLHAHRKAQLTKTADSQKHRAVLATKAMGVITRQDMQRYMDAMRAEGVAPATMRLEQSVWRVLFKYAVSKWAWASLHDNPATDLALPQVDNERKRVMSLSEQTLLDASLADCRNSMVAHIIVLLRETAMRSSEPLERATWGDVNWERRILTLRDAKSGQRDVPLSAPALQALSDLGPAGAGEPIVNISYEALKASWQRACKRAGISDLNLHDLRRTAATRLALKTGNRFLVQALTGHKSMVMVDRYVNVGADDVVALMHAPAATPDAAPPAAASTACAPGPLAQAARPTITLTPQQLQELVAQAVAAGLAGLSASPAAPAQAPQSAAQDCGYADYAGHAPATCNVMPMRRAA